MSAGDSEPSLCARGCGFFGRPENKNLCSKCYKDLIKEEAAKHLAALKPQPETPKLPQSAAEEEVTAGKPPAAAAPAAGAKRRCKICSRKVGLLGFDCRCGHVYCGLHRYPEEHSCPSDYKRAAREALAKQNPLIKADKLDRIQ